MTDGRIPTTFSPDFRVYLRKVLLIASCWALPSLIAALAQFSSQLADGFFAVGTVTLLGAAVVSFAGSLLYMFWFNELHGWGNAKHSVWSLEKHHLVLNDLDGEHRLPYSEITAVRRHFWWSVRLRLSNGQAVLMEYIVNNKNAVKIISQAVADHTKGSS